MPMQDLNVGMRAGPLSGNPHMGRNFNIAKATGGNPHIAKTTGASPVKDWIYKGDTKGRAHYQNMNYKTAMKGENPIGKKFPFFGTNPDYKGYNLGYEGTDKTNFFGKGGYLKQGIDSLFGKSLADSNISGGTTGSRYAYEKGMKAAAALTPVGRLANVGNLAYQGTNAVIDQFGLRDNLKKLGGSIFDFTNGS